MKRTVLKGKPRSLKCFWWINMFASCYSYEGEEDNDDAVWCEPRRRYSGF